MQVCLVVVVQSLAAAGARLEGEPPARVLPFALVWAGACELCPTPLTPQLRLSVVFWSAAVESAGFLELLRSVWQGYLTQNVITDKHPRSPCFCSVRCSPGSFTLPISPLSAAYFIYLPLGLRTFGIDTFFPPQINIGVLRPQRQASKRDSFVCSVGGCPPRDC